MNWKDQPHLFANGKFKVEYNERNRYTNLLNTSCRKIIGVNGKYLIIRRSEMLIDRELPRNCTLIARPIADLSDEEVKTRMDLYEVPPRSFCDRVIDNLTELVEKDGLSVEAFLYLLSIGVYPFDQSHFQTGEVLNINEVTA